MTIEHQSQQETQSDKEKRWGLTVADIRDRSIQELAIIIGDLSKQGAEPPVDVVKALLSRWIKDQNGRYYYGEHATALPTPFPQVDDAYSELKPSRPRYKHDDSQEVINAKEYEIFPNGIDFMYEREVAGQIAVPVIDQLSSQKKKEAAEWLLFLLDKTKIPYDDFDVFYALRKWIAESSDSEGSVGIMLEYLVDNPNTRALDEYSDLYEVPPLTFDSLADFFEYTLYLMEDINPAILYTAKQPMERMLKIIGVIVDARGFPTVLNSIRELISEKSTTDAETRLLLERMGKIMLGVDPDDPRYPFHKCLADVYKSLHFEEYAPNQEADMYEVPILKSIFADEPDSVHMYFGSGTGRIPYQLAKAGIRNLHGIDTSPENVDTAQKFNEELPAENQVDYKIESWDHTSMADNSVDNITSFGRAFPHVENARGFTNMATEANRILKLGGIMRFDFPLNTDGEYLEGRKKYLQFLKNIGYPVHDDEEAMRRIEYVVDSPSRPDDPEIHLYNRYVPYQDTIVEILRICGFEVVELDQRAIVDANGEKKGTTVYYEAVKVKDLQERKAFIHDLVQMQVQRAHEGKPAKDIEFPGLDITQYKRKLQEDKLRWQQAAQEVMAKAA